MWMSLFKPRSRGPRRVRLQDGTSFDVLAGETLLDAALRCGLRAPYNCRVGACKTCCCQVVGGSARSLVDRSYVLQRQDIRDGMFLACQTQPGSDLQLNWEMAQGHADPNARTRSATLVGSRPMTARVWRVSILLPVVFHALPGQHIGISGALEGGPPGVRQFSLVNVAHAVDSTRLDIDVACHPCGRLSAWMTRDEAVGSALQVTGPFGECVAETRSGPLIAIGAGSGIGAAAGVLAHSHVHSPQRATTLLAYARSAHDIYGLEDLADSARRANARHRAMAWAKDYNAVMPHVAPGRAPDGLAAALREHHAAPAPASGPAAAAQVLLYGPCGFVDSCLATLKQCRVPAECIRFDRYQAFKNASSQATTRSFIGV